MYPADVSCTGRRVNAPLTGLTPNTTYYFRIAASNRAGINRSPILSFTVSNGVLSLTKGKRPYWPG